MIKFKRIFIILLLSFPFLVSFETSKVDIHSISSFQSPEGIQFVSYTPSWDQNKLKELYKELLLNKHGQEIGKLSEVRILGDTHASSNTKGSYNSLTNTIVLYQGNRYLEPIEYRETLSHEYGHHFAYTYFPSHHFPFSKWQRIRGIDVSDMRWDAFWNYDDRYHSLYPQEIIADDYVLLYGATSKLVSDEVSSNEAFYLRTEHENQQIPNVLENVELHSFLEEETGISIDQSRIFTTPKLVKWDDKSISLSISSKPQVAYRLNLEIVNKHNEKQTFELYEITTEETNHLEFSIKDHDLNISDLDHAIISIDVVDLTTSLGFETEETTLSF